MTSETTEANAMTHGQSRIRLCPQFKLCDSTFEQFDSSRACPTSEDPARSVDCQERLHKASLADLNISNTIVERKYPGYPHLHGMNLHMIIISQLSLPLRQETTQDYFQGICARYNTLSAHTHTHTHRAQAKDITYGLRISPSISSPRWSLRFCQQHRGKCCQKPSLPSRTEWKTPCHFVSLFLTKIGRAHV